MFYRCKRNNTFDLSAGVGIKKRQKRLLFKKMCLNLHQDKSNEHNGCINDQFD